MEKKKASYKKHFEKKKDFLWKDLALKPQQLHFICIIL